jgi:NAD(P)H-flavin reductase
MVNIFGNRYEQDILYKEEFEKLAEENPSVTNIFTVSRPVKWDGETEYVQHVLKKYCEYDTNTEIHICGLSAMIAEVETIATEMGFSKNQIIYEKYD